MKALIQPVILSGGSGTRLWPLSRHAKPKQFATDGDLLVMRRGESQRVREVVAALEQKGDA